MARDDLAACTICARLPRDRSWSRDSDLPVEWAQLARDGELLRCPLCGRLYAHSYEEEWDRDLHSQTWTLRRLTPPEVLQQTRSQAVESFIRSYDPFIARLRAELHDPQLEVRSEAAFDLTAQLIHTNDWAGLRELLSVCEGPARARALAVIESGNLLPNELVDLFQRYLSDEDGDVRFYAASILWERARKRGEIDAMHRLLASSDQPVLLAVAPRLFSATKRGFDPAPFFARLAELRRHHNETIRKNAASTLAALAAKAKSVDPLSMFVEDLAASEVAQRIQAASAIEELVRVRTDAGKALPYVMPLLRDKDTAFYALEALKAFFEAGAELEPALPILVEQATARTSTRRHDILYFLQRLAKKHVDLRPHHAQLSQLLSADEESRRVVMQIFADAPGNLAAVADPLRATVDDPAPYLREAAARLLARFYIRRRNVEGLRFLLQHKHVEAISTCADALSQSRVEAGNLPDLIALINHDTDYVRAHVADAIVRFAEKKPAVVEAALRSVPESTALTQLRTKLAARRGQ